jgi:squalene synthase HpnC
MGVGHYENFPVASVVMPAHLRRPIAAIYHFARSADDIADEGDASAPQRLAQLAAYGRALDALARGETPLDPLFVALQRAIREHDLPIGLFHDLLSAFSQDVVKTRYATFAELLDYCRRSADPIGRLLLHLFGTTDAQSLSRSDAICSALQLINFWQDVAIDQRKQRIYLPQEDLERFGVGEAQIAAGDTSGAWSALMRFQVARARAMLESGAPLARQLRGRIGLELALVVQGGLRVLEKLDAVDGDVFKRRPVLRPWDWMLMLTRALAPHQPFNRTA